MSRHGSLMQALGRPALFHFHGQAGAVTYVAPDSSTTDLTDAVIGPEWTEEETDNDGARVRIVRRRQLWISTAELAAVPLTGKFTFAGETWAVEKIISSSEALIRVQVTRRATKHHSRPNLREK